MNYWIRSAIIVFIIGLIAGSCISQDRFVITPRHQEFIITERVDASTDVIVEADGEKIRLERTDDPSRFSFSAKPADEPAVIKEVTIKNWKPKRPFVDDEFYAVMFTASWCGPCQQYKTSGKLDRLKAKFATTVIDIDAEPQWRVGRVPSFWLCRRSDQTKVKGWTGATSVETIESEVTRIRQTKSGTVATTRTVLQSRNPSLFGRVGTSHESRQTLIFHLANEGIHRGKRSVAELGGMSDDALDALHSKDHGWR